MQTGLKPASAMPPRGDEGESTMQTGKNVPDPREPLAVQRREFLKSSGILALLSTISITVIGCEGEKDAVSSIEVVPSATPPEPAAQAAAPSSRSDDMDAARPPADPASPTPSDPAPDPTPPPDPRPEPTQCTPISGQSTSDFGHTHSFQLGALQQQIALPITLQLNCAGGHIHTVALSRADLLAICAGSPVFRESSFDAGHTHAVMFNV
jgi:hypothetical protein